MAGSDQCVLNSKQSQNKHPKSHKQMKWKKKIHAYMRTKRPKPNREIKNLLQQIVLGKLYYQK